MFVESENRKNIDTVIAFFDEVFPLFNFDDFGNCLDIHFESKWTFPEKEMQELYEAIPDKSDIYMRCLSVEYGCMYHALWYCEKDGWHEA